MSFLLLRYRARTTSPLAPRSSSTSALLVSSTTEYQLQEQNELI
jgi:hypothetical protein